jgi:hypothetical protein
MISYRNNNVNNLTNKLISKIKDIDSLYYDCIQMINNKSLFKTNIPELFDTNKIYIDFGASVNTQQIPTKVLELNPRKIVILSNCLHIILQSGELGNIEIIAFKDGNGRMGEDNNPKDFKLREGLWIKER